MSLNSDLAALDVFMKRLGYLRRDKEQYVPFKPAKVGSKPITFNRAVRLYNDNFWSLKKDKLRMEWGTAYGGKCKSFLELNADAYRFAKTKDLPYVVKLCYSKKKRKITYYGED